MTNTLAVRYVTEQLDEEIEVKAVEIFPIHSGNIFCFEKWNCRLLINTVCRYCMLIHSRPESKKSRWKARASHSR